MSRNKAVIAGKEAADKVLTCSIFEAIEQLDFCVPWQTNQCQQFHQKQVKMEMCIGCRTCTENDEIMHQ